MLRGPAGRRRCASVAVTRTCRPHVLFASVDDGCWSSEQDTPDAAAAPCNFMSTTWKNGPYARLLRWLACHGGGLPGL